MTISDGFIVLAGVAIVAAFIGLYCQNKRSTALDPRQEEKLAMWVWPTDAEVENARDEIDDFKLGVGMFISGAFFWACVRWVIWGSP